MNAVTKMNMNLLLNHVISIIIHHTNELITEGSQYETGNGTLQRSNVAFLTVDNLPTIRASLSTHSYNFIYGTSIHLIKIS